MYTPSLPKRVLMAINPCSPHDPNAATNAAVPWRLGEARLLFATGPCGAAIVARRMKVNAPDRNDDAMN
jgi:hypothetical protein